MEPMDRPNFSVPMEVRYKVHLHCCRCVTSHSSDSRGHSPHHSVNIHGYWIDSSSGCSLCSRRSALVYRQTLLDLLDRRLPLLLLLHCSPSREEGGNAEYGSETAAGGGSGKDRAFFFEDLERGIHLADLQVKTDEVKTKDIKAEDGTTVRASCSLDAHLPGGSTMDVVFFPVVQGGSVTFGLLLRLIKGTADRYERLGVFETSHQQLKKLHHPSKDEIILLV